MSKSIEFAPVIYFQIPLAVGSCVGSVVWFSYSFTRCGNWITHHPAKTLISSVRD
jgi:hypothetical protein